MHVKDALGVLGFNMVLNTMWISVLTMATFFPAFLFVPVIHAYHSVHNAAVVAVSAPLRYAAAVYLRLLITLYHCKRAVDKMRVIILDMYAVATSPRAAARLLVWLAVFAVRTVWVCSHYSVAWGPSATPLLACFPSLCSASSELRQSITRVRMESLRTDPRKFPHPKQHVSGLGHWVHHSENRLIARLARFARHYQDSQLSGYEFGTALGAFGRFIYPLFVSIL